jgi:hypothetical protein
MNVWKTLASTALIAGALVAEPNSASAQLVLGAKLGATFSTLDFDPDEGGDQSRLTSFGGGGFLRFGMAGLSLQPELLAVTKGSKFDDTDGSGKIKLDYIEVPVFLRFGLSSGASFAPYLMVGPSFSFDIGCSLEGESGGVSVDVDCDDTGLGEDFIDRNKFDIGAAAALGFEFAAGPGNILVEGRYTHGFSDIDKGEGSKARNRMFGVFAGYAIPLGTR